MHHGLVSLEFDPAALHAAADRLELRMIVLFGSRATGSPPTGPESDLDLALAVADRQRVPDHWAIDSELGKLFPRESLDTVFLEGADPLFRWEIVRDGVLLHG